MMLFLFLSCLALGAASLPEQQKVKLLRGKCPMFWYNFGDRCYKYVATDMTWADAELYCVSEGANLVSMHSVEEHNFVNSLIQNFDHARGRTWIGLSDLHKEGAWMWSDGSKVSFAFWNTGEPNNREGREHCGHTNWGTNFKWNDELCSHAFPSVCASRTVRP